MRWWDHKRTRATLTLHTAQGADITVALTRSPGAYEWAVDDAVDEDGHPVALTPQEHYQLCRRAEAGEDETGVEP